MLSSFIAVDTETTGLDFENDRVIELAAVRFENGIPVADFTALLSPGDRSLSPVSRLITGLTDAELLAAPPAADTWRAFLDFAGSTPLVAHNAEFDAHFVRKSLEAAGLPPLPGVWVDSLLLSRIAWPMWDSHRLDSLAERLRVPRDAEHRALPDARRAGYVFEAAQRFVRGNLSSSAWNDLARLSAGLPDWGLVFHGAGGVTAATGTTAGDRAIVLPAEDSALPADSGTPEGNAAVGHAIAEALGGETWLALEVPPRVEEHAAGLRAALVAAKTGQRVLLAVPDLSSWNALRKKNRTENGGPANLSVRVAALATPGGYLSRSRLKALTDNPARVPAEERAALLPLVAWADRNPEGPVADGRGFSPDRARLAWSRVCCESWNDDASARGAREAAAGAGVILVTHATLCAHLASEGALLPPCDSLIVTGAHRYPETLQSPAGAGRTVSLARLREALQALRFAPGSDADSDAGLWAECADALSGTDREAWRTRWFEPEHRMLKFLQTAGRHATRQRPHGDFRVRYTEPVVAGFAADPAPVSEALRENLDFIAEIVTAVKTTNPDGNLPAELHRLAARLRAFRADFGALCEPADADTAETVYWMEDGSNPPRASLRSAPVSGSLFGGTLRDLFGAGVFLGPAVVAGANPGRDARFLLRAAGLVDGDSEAAVRRISDDAPAPLFLTAPAAPFLGTGDQADEFARYLLEAARPFVAQGVRVFCPSQTAVRSLYGALRRLLPAEIPLWAQHLDGNRDAVARLYASGRGGFVLAAEGLPGLRDLDGNEPALWIVARMPLPPPHDPLLEARGEALRAEGGNAKLELWQPAAILRLKRDWAAIRFAESFPRGAEGAKGLRALWLLDGRAATEGLGARFAAALGCAPEAVKGIADLQARTATVLPATAFSTTPPPETPATPIAPQGLS